jgi:hypothetical protein
VDGLSGDVRVAPEVTADGSGFGPLVDAEGPAGTV